MKRATTPISQIVPQSAAWMPALSAVIDVKLVMKCQSSVPVPSRTTSTRSTARRPIAIASAGEQREPKGDVLRPPRAGGPADRGVHGAHSYTCLYLRTKRIEIMFITNVITNSVVPTAKIVL